MSHFAFVNPGGPQVPDLAKAKRYGITRLYWQANDVQVDAALFASIRANPDWRGIELGTMRDLIWGTLNNVEYDAATKAGKSVAPLDAPTLAKTMSQDITRLGMDNKQCAALADIEVHSVTYLTIFLRSWRTLRPNRVTGWTLEPMQGGWITADLCKMLVMDEVTVFPQTFHGDMTPVNADLVRSQLVTAGLPRGMVAPVYDGAHIPDWWDGIAFRFDQLP